MAINIYPVRPRTYPTDREMNAGGGFTLPRYVFIPSPALTPLSQGRVPQPSVGGVSARFAGQAQQLNRPYPVPLMPAYGVRVANVKVSPGR